MTTKVDLLNEAIAIYKVRMEQYMGMSKNMVQAAAGIGGNAPSPSSGKVAIRSTASVEVPSPSGSSSYKLLDTLNVPLYTENGRIAARRYAELEGDQGLLLKLNRLDKEAHEASKVKP